MYQFFPSTTIERRKIAAVLYKHRLTVYARQQRHQKQFITNNLLINHINKISDINKHIGNYLLILFVNYCINIIKKN